MTYDMFTLPVMPAPAPLEPRHPGMLATNAELCQHWKDLDAHFGTERGDYMHHDWRCEIHGRRIPKDHCESCFGFGILKRAAIRMPNSDLPLCAPCAKPALQYLGLL